jgi:zinc/manganese transport system substrate-binding protein
MRAVLIQGAKKTTVTALALAATLAACGDAGGADDGPHVVVTTSILGDVVQNLVGDAVAVDVVMPAGSDPHSFAPSARQVAAIRDADLLVTSGLGFEAGLEDTIEAAADDGTEVAVAADPVETLPSAGQDEHGDADPHFFTDPTRMRVAVEHLAVELADHVAGLDTSAYRTRVAAYLDQLDQLDSEVTSILAVVPPDRRVLVTNHEVFAYFADRYGLEVLGTLIPGGTTLAEPSAGDLSDLAAEIARAGVPAIFAETSSPTRLADALAAEGTDVEVVELYTESLGEPGSDGDTYLGMVRANAERIAAALG